MGISITKASALEGLFLTRESLLTASHSGKRLTTGLIAELAELQHGPRKFNMK